MKFPWNEDMKDSIIIPPQLEYEVVSYPDGSKYVKSGQYGPDLTYKINSYDDLWILAQINDVLKHKQVTVDLLIPNLLDAQADRRFDINQPHSLRMVCNFINGLTQFKTIGIFHPHNPEVVEALIDRVEIIDNSDFIYEVLCNIKGEHYEFNAHDLQSNLILMSTDAGGFKPLMKLCDKVEWEGETYSASKSRKYENNHSKLTQTVDRKDFGGKDILIIDDISVGGGTFKGLAKILKEKNCGKLFLAVSHITLESLGQDPVSDYFTKVYTTNSKFNDYYGRDNIRINNLDVIKLF